MAWSRIFDKVSLFTFDKNSYVLGHAQSGGNRKIEELQPYNIGKTRDDDY